MGPRPYTVVSRDGNYGEIHFAPVILPEGAPAGKVGDTPGRSVSNELAAAIQRTAEKDGDLLNPRVGRDGTPEQRKLAGLSRNQFLSLADDFRTLNELTTRPIYRQFAVDKSPALRALGITGLIAANDPEGVKRAAAEWTELAASADVNPIIASLMSYANDGDSELTVGTEAGVPVDEFRKTRAAVCSENNYPDVSGFGVFALLGRPGLAVTPSAEILLGPVEMPSRPRQRR